MQSLIDIFYTNWAQISLGVISCIIFQLLFEIIISFKNKIRTKISKDRNYFIERETYYLSDKVGKNRNSSFIALKKSSVEDASGFVLIDANRGDDKKELILNDRAFYKTYSNNLFFLGSNLLLDKNEWEEKIITNGLEIIRKSTKEIINKEELKKIYKEWFNKGISRKILSITDEFVIVKSTFDGQTENDNFEYNNYSAIWGKGIGLICARTDFTNQDYQKIKLRKWNTADENEKYWFPYNTKGNYWVYDIRATRIYTELSLSEGKNGIVAYTELSQGLSNILEQESKHSTSNS